MPGMATLTMNPAVDAFATVDRVVPDETLRCRDTRQDAGGGGINVARAILHLGGKATAMFPMGGPEGDLLAGLLEDEGVRVAPVRISGSTREDLTLYESQSARQFRAGQARREGGSGAGGRFGVVAGAAAVMTPGTELCRPEDTERLFERIRDSNGDGS